MANAEIFMKQPPEEFCKKGILIKFHKFTGKHLRRGLYFNTFTCLSPATLSKKETPTQLFSCEFSEIFMKIFFSEHLRTIASKFYRFFFLY